MAVVLGTETVTIILDDTISVWPEHQHNLMQVTIPHLKHSHPAGGFAVRSCHDTSLQTSLCMLRSRSRSQNTSGLEWEWGGLVCQEHCTCSDRFVPVYVRPYNRQMQAALQVERYIFFPACAERFGLQTPGLLREGRDEDGEWGMLHSALQVLEEASIAAFMCCLTLHPTPRWLISLCSAYL